MKIEFDIISIITALGIGQGVFLSIAILGIKSGNIKANRILALLMLLMSISIGHGVMTYTNLYYFMPHLILIGPPLSFLLGPLCLLYFKYLTDSGYKFSFRKKLMLIPFVISVVVLIPFYIKSGPEKLALLTSFIADKKLYPPSQILSVLSIPHMWIYLVIIWKRVNEYKQRIEADYSTIDKINLSWIKYFVIFFAFSFSMMIPITLFRLTGNLNLAFERIIPLAGAICIYYFGYMGFQQTIIALETDTSDKTKDFIKYEKSNLTRKQSLEYKNQLLELMNNDKIYRDPDLTLSDLAREIEINRNLLSQIINDEFKQNFYGFINTFRVEEIKEIIKNTDNETSLLKIAMDAGFNSKATFNAVFKKITGLTPSVYKKEVIKGI